MLLYFVGSVHTLLEVTIELIATLTRRMISGLFSCRRGLRRFLKLKLDLVPLKTLA